MAFPKAASLVAGVCILVASGFAACAEEKSRALICEVDFLGKKMGILEFTIGVFDDVGPAARYISATPGTESELYDVSDLDLEDDELYNLLVHLPPPYKKVEIKIQEELEDRETLPGIAKFTNLAPPNEGYVFCRRIEVGPDFLEKPLDHDLVEKLFSDK